MYACTRTNRPTGFSHLALATGTTRTAQSRARSVLGVFVVVLLNLVVQPCAMALGSAEEHDCPHCPPEHTSEHMGHEMRGHDMASHDKAQATKPCATDATNCSLAEELNYDGRTVKLELKDSPSDSPIAMYPAVANVLAQRPVATTGWHSSRSPPPTPSIPLNVLNCVYLK